MTVKHLSLARQTPDATRHTSQYGQPAKSCLRSCLKCSRKVAEKRVVFGCFYCLFAFFASLREMNSAFSTSLSEGQAEPCCEKVAKQADRGQTGKRGAKPSQEWERDLAPAPRLAIAPRPH
jgi:hypothetical protein